MPRKASFFENPLVAPKPQEKDSLSAWKETMQSMDHVKARTADDKNRLVVLRAGLFSNLIDTIHSHVFAPTSARPKDVREWFIITDVKIEDLPRRRGKPQEPRVVVTFPAVGKRVATEITLSDLRQGLQNKPDVFDKTVRQLQEIAERKIKARIPGSDTEKSLLATFLS